MRITYHPDARTELTAAARFYNGIAKSLGARFLDAVDAAIKNIEHLPVSWRIVEGDVRCCHIPGFPFAIYYRVTPGRIRILAVKHNRQRPDYWRSRLTN